MPHAQARGLPARPTCPCNLEGQLPPPHPGEGAEGQLYLPFSLPQGSSAPLVVFLASRQPRFVQC